MRRYLYSGPDSGASLRHKGKVLERLLWNGKPVELPEDHPYTRRLLKLGHLTPIEEPPTSVLEGNVGEVLERIETVAEEALQELRQAEAAGRNRSTVIRAIDRRLTDTDDGGNH